MKLSGWGRYPVLEAKLHTPRKLEELQDLICSELSVIARGSGLAYGDSAINAGATIEMRYFNKILAFDDTSGQLIAETGVTIGEIISVFMSRGWFPIVTPGTKYVTLGGAIAADIHGKNHHKDGSFRTCIDWLDIIGADGEIQRCSRNENSHLFEHTIGGMGLTGVILRAAIRLKPIETGWIKQTTIQAPNLKSAMTALDLSEEKTYSVAWIDCLGVGKGLGKSIIKLGEHATLTELPQELSGKRFIKNKKYKLALPSLRLLSTTLVSEHLIRFTIGIVLVKLKSDLLNGMITFSH